MDAYDIIDLKIKLLTPLVETASIHGMKHEVIPMADKMWHEFLVKGIPEELLTPHSPSGQGLNKPSAPKK